MAVQQQQQQPLQQAQRPQPRAQQQQLQARAPGPSLAPMQTCRSTLRPATSSAATPCAGRRATLPSPARWTCMRMLPVCMAPAALWLCPCSPSPLRPPLALALLLAALQHALRRQLRAGAALPAVLQAAQAAQHSRATMLQRRGWAARRRLSWPWLWRCQRASCLLLLAALGGAAGAEE
jgi:hypothetical protein